MWVPHSGYSPTHGSLGWPSLNPSPARSCCVAAGLNTAHCVSAPSQPQTVPTNVLLIRWLNYSCKNNVDISLKIALCQILLAVIGPQPLLSNSPVWPPPLPPPTLAHCLFLAPPKLFLTLLIFFLHISFALSCRTQKHRRTVRRQIFHKEAAAVCSVTLMPTGKKAWKALWNVRMNSKNNNTLIKAEKKELKKSDPLQLRSVFQFCVIDSLGLGTWPFILVCCCP